MARKRLSNLNPEESKKASQPPVEPTPLPDSEQENLKPPDVNATDVKKHKAEISSAKPLEIDVSYVEVKDGAGEDAAGKDAANEDAAGQDVAGKDIAGKDAAARFEATIAELNTTLDATRQTAKQRETELLDQIAQLQTTLKSEQPLTKQLQTELKQAGQLKIELENTKKQSSQLQTELESAKKQSSQLKAELEDAKKQSGQFKTELEDTKKQFGQLKTELEDAKKMILQLSQVNAQPTLPRSPLPQIQAAVPELEPSSPNPMQQQPKVQPQGDDRQPAPLALQRQSAYPARPPSFSEPPERISPERISPERKPSERLVVQDSNLSDADMGWVD